MEIFVLSMMFAFAGYTLKSRAEAKRIALLGLHLGNYQIEKLMETLTEGYARALGEEDAARRASIWQLMSGTEEKLAAQFKQLADSLAKVDAQETGVNLWPWPLSEAAQWAPNASFDLRKALKIHAEGLARAANHRDDVTAPARAFTFSAELFLMQHTCHWFCKSKTVASARMLVRHKTPYEMVLQSVSPETRRAYNALIGPQFSG
jgi:hypothetical protein